MALMIEASHHSQLNFSAPSILDLPDFDLDERSSRGGWLVRVFNNETNTYEEVITILMLATGCDVEEAYIETWEIDHLGQSVVHIADKTECEEVAKVIAKIGIRTEVEEDN
jgi:ATP-dependent Clp protease adaptor protein ClpS